MTFGVKFKKKKKLSKFKTLLLPCEFLFFEIRIEITEDALFKKKNM